MHNFFDQLIRARKAQGLTQKALAEKAGLTQSMISAFERKKSDIRFSSLMRLLDALNLRLVAVEYVDMPLVMDIVEKRVEEEPPSLLDEYGVPDDDE